MQKTQTGAERSSWGSYHVTWIFLQEGFGSGFAQGMEVLDGRISTE